MYDLVGYGDMIADSVRTEAYARALRGAVTPDSVVLDIGTGTGLFALLACRFGARHVYAAEPSDAIAVARDIARANGLYDRITFIQDRSDHLTLPEPVDVIVSDIRGILPMCKRSLQSINDARRRFLAPAGALIPATDTLMAAPVEAPNLYRRHVHPWERPTHDLDMSAAQELVKNAWYRGRAQPQELLAPARSWATLDYATLESAAVSGKASWTVGRPGTVFGLSVWFDSELGADAVISNAPDEAELVYGSAFFPMSEPVDVNDGDRIDVRFRADPVGDDYVWSWTTAIRAPEEDEFKAEFNQSTFYSIPMVQAQLRKRAASHRPVLTEDGWIALLILGSMKEGDSLEEIVKRLRARYPARFADWREALDYVCTFSGKYSEASIKEEETERRTVGGEAPALLRS